MDWIDISEEELEWLKEPIESELKKLGTNYSPEMIVQMSKQIKYIYEKPDFMLNLPKNARESYEKFVNIFAENMQKKQMSTSVNKMILQDNINGQRGFLNIILLSLVMIMLVMLIVYIMS